MENNVFDAGPSPFDGPENLFMVSNDAFQWEPTRNLILDNGKQEAVINFDGDEVTYSGDLPVSESAKLMFNALFQQFKPRCRTCRWYSQEDSYHTCLCPKMYYGFGRLAEDLETDEILIENDGSWGMVPRPDFGCIHHEEKTDGLNYPL